MESAPGRSTTEPLAMFSVDQHHLDFGQRLTDFELGIHSS